MIMQYQKRIWVSFLAALLAALAAGGCGGASRGSGDGRVSVVATFSVLGDIVGEVGGDGVDLATLVGPNSDAHTFEPAPRDTVKLAEAAVVFENGLEFESWLDELYESSGSEAERVTVTKNVDLLAALEEEHEGEAHEGEAHEGGEEESDEADPHVWHDVENVMTITGAVRDALVEVDPENAESYRANAEEYMAELEELDAEVVRSLEAVPEDDRVLFTSHDTFGYFAERYGFRVDTALASVSTEASDPSAGETAALIREIETSGVPAVFAENVGDSGSMRRVAEEAGVELAPALYTDALGGPGSEGGTYAKMMRYNASTITDALSE